MKTPKPIPRAVFDSIWTKWLDGRGQSKGAMMKWWLETGHKCCAICKYVEGKADSFRGNYCSLKNGICDGCISALSDVETAAYTNNHQAYTSACDAMLVAIARIPVIEEGRKCGTGYCNTCSLKYDCTLLIKTFNKPKPFVEGQPVWYQNSDIVTLATQSRLDPRCWQIILPSGNYLHIHDSQIRHLTKDELAEWKKGQGARDLMKASEATRKAVKNYEAVLAKKPEPKAPEFHEGDVVWFNGKVPGQPMEKAQIVTLESDSGGGWYVYAKGFKWCVYNSAIRHLTEEEWVNTTGEGEKKVEFKARCAESGNIRLIKTGESILSNRWEGWIMANSGSLLSKINKAIIKALDIKVMPFEQWKRLRELGKEAE